MFADIHIQVRPPSVHRDWEIQMLSLDDYTSKAGSQVLEEDIHGL